MHKFRYIQSNLLQNEKLLYVQRPHWIIFLHTVLAFAVALWFYHWGPLYPILRWVLLRQYYLYQICATLATFIGIMWGIAALFRYFTSEYAVTNERVLMKTGWLKRQALEIFLQRIESTQVDQTILGRFLGYGSINIMGTGGTKDSFPFVRYPLTFRKIVQQQTEAILQRHNNPTSPPFNGS